MRSSLAMDAPMAAAVESGLATQADLGVPPRSAIGPRTAWILVGILTCVSAGLALSTLTGRSLSVDEAYTMGVAMTPAARFIDDLAYNGGNMSLYLVFMRAWLVAGDSDFWLRLPSVIFGAACVPAFYVLARRLVSVAVAVVGAGLIALSAPLIHQAQDARSYSLTALLVILSWSAALETQSGSSSPSARRWYVLLAVAVVYSHILGLLVVAAQLLWLLTERRGDALRAGTWIAVLIVPQLLLAVGPQASAPSWIAPTSGAGLASTLRYLTGTTTSAAAGAVGALWVLGGIIARRRGGQLMMVPLVWVLLPVSALLMISTVSPMLMPRYLLMVVPGTVLLVCIACDSRPRVGVALVVAVAALSVPGLHETLNRSRPDWDVAMRLVVEESDDDEVVLFIETRQPVEHYWDQAGRPGPVPRSLSDPGEWGAMQRVYDLDVAESIAMLDEAEGVWLVQLLDILGPEDEPVLAEIERRWRASRTWSWAGGAITIVHYDDART